MEFVWIPRGPLGMGSTNGEANEKPEHVVVFYYFFSMSKYEVTQAQWQAIMGNNPSYFKDCGGNCPVETVSWKDAQDFIRKLNQLDDGYTYRLPTEAEWEHACRAETTGDYAGDLKVMAWFSENSGSATRPVGQKQPNAFGLFDTHGNVWEWCEDWYHSDYIGAPTDGSAWLSGGEQKSRVLRGGSWFDDATNVRSASRKPAAPDVRNPIVGFRVVAVVRKQADSPAEATTTNPNSSSTVAKDAPAGSSGTVYLGTIPKYEDSNDGLELEAVRDDSPAAKAGLKAGDRIVKMAGREVRGVGDFRRALGLMKAGQEYEVEIIREGKRLTLKIIPEATK